jgi:hypothetical protein
VSRLRPLARAMSVVLVVLMSFLLRWRAAQRLPIDYDEDDYLRAAQPYARAMRAGDWYSLTQSNYRPEHPPLSKLIMGVALAHLPAAG